MVVVLEHAGVEQAGDLEFQNRGHRHAQRGIDLGLGDRYQRDHVARIDRQPVGQPGTEQDAAVHPGLLVLKERSPLMIEWGSEVTGAVPVSGRSPPG